MDSKSAVFIADNCKYIKHIRHIARRVHFLRNGKNCKIHNIDWCEGGLQLAYIETKNFDKNYLDPVMKYIMVRFYNWYKTLVQEGW